MIQFFLADGSLAETISFASLNAGEDSDVLSIEVWNDRDAPGGVERRHVQLLLQTEDPTRPEVWLSKGVPPQDELWGRWRITGFHNRGDATWTLQTTDWRLWGAYRAVEIARIPADCAVLLDVRMRPPSSAAQVSYRWQIVALYDEYARPLPPALTSLSQGILLHHGDRSQSYVLRGCQVSISDPVDDTLTTAPGLWLYRGEVFGKVTEPVVLDQIDVDGAALSLGESYLATLSLGTDLRITKGRKSASPSPPARPPGEAFLATVEVHHELNGSSVLAEADLSGIPPSFGRFHAEPGQGLELLIDPGQAIAGETLRWRGLRESLALADEAVQTVWILSSGPFEIASDPPEETALALWRVTTAAGVITEFEDVRIYAGSPIPITLRGSTPTSPGLVEGFWWDGPGMVIERVIARVSENGISQGATAGDTVLDVLVEGVSIFDHAAEDLRPRFPWDSAELVERNAFYQTARIPAGTRIGLEVVEMPTGGAPPNVQVTLMTYKES